MMNVADLPTPKVRLRAVAFMARKTCSKFSSRLATRQRVRLAPRFHGTQNMQQVLLMPCELGGWARARQNMEQGTQTREQDSAELSTHLARMRRPGSRSPDRSG
jgi:hypothetical protein